MSSRFLFSVSLAFLTSLSLKGFEFLLKEGLTTDHRKHYDSFKNPLFMLICVQLIFDSLPSSFPSKIQSKNATKCVG